MNKESKILITGSSGMVGSALTKNLLGSGFTNLLIPSRMELDL